MNIPAHITEFLRTQGALPPGTGFLVACSGGRDSVTLSAVMHELAQKWRVRVEIINIDHGLRPEAAAEAEFVRTLGEGMGMQVHLLSVDVKGEAAAGQGSVQSVARALRYEAMGRVLDERGLDWLLTAHHAGDQAETMLWRFLAGAGVEGLRGIPPVNGRTLRPLLDVDPVDIAEYARSRALNWMEDASNSSDMYLRNAIRHHVLPPIREHVTPSPEMILGRTAKFFSSMADFLDAQTTELSAGVIRAEGDAVYLAVLPLKGYFEFQQLLLVRKALRDAGIREPGFEATYAVLRLLDAEAGKRAVPGDGFLAFRDREDVVIVPNRRLPDARQVRLGESVQFGQWVFSSGRSDFPTGFSDDPMEEYVDLAAAGDTWVLRTWQPGDRFRPLGMDGEKCVSDLLTDRRIPAHEKPGIPVLERNGEILWVCGVRLAGAFRINAATSDCALVTLRKAAIT